MSRVLGAGLAAAVLAILTLDIVALVYVGVSPADLLILAVALLAWARAGGVLLSRLRTRFPDRLSFWAAGTALGMVVHAALGFAMLHSGTIRALGLPDNRAAAQVAFTALVALALSRRVRPPSATQAIAVAPAASVLLLALASVVAALSAFGYLNNPADHGGVAPGRAALQGSAAEGQRPNWGSAQDRESQLMGGRLGRAARFPHAFPFGKVSHRGVETMLTSVALLGGDFSKPRFAAVSKPLCLIWLSLSGYWMLMIAYDRSCDGRVALAAGAGVFLYAAFNVFAFRAPVSSYPLAPASGTLYHNVHQQASLAIGLAGVWLALRELRRPAGLFLAAGAIIAGSFFFKPSLYAVLVPAIGVGLLLRRDTWRTTDTLAGLGAIATAAGVWFAYPRLFDVSPRWSVILDFAFLPWHRGSGRAAMGWPVESELALLAWVVVLGHAALLLPAASALARLAAEARRGGIARALRLPAADTTALLLAFATGLSSGYLIRAESGNYMWGSAVGVLCLLPVLVTGIAAIASPRLRRLAWAVYLAHLASGAWNLWLFARDGLILPA